MNMTRYKVASLIAAVLFSGAAHAAQHHQHGTQIHQPETSSPYAAAMEREIKSLSPDEIAALRSGGGMGLAMPAELNGYPGPRHVLDLAAELSLTDAQRDETETLFNRMRQQAVALGEQIIQGEKQLEAAFASGSVDASSLERHLSNIASLQGKLRLAHLTAHLEMKRLLTAAQIAEYNRLRGYGTSR
jgi:Spy/CpxP family protein refolding chaperone